MCAISQPATLKKFTMEELNREMDQAELDVAEGRLIDESIARQERKEFVRKKLGL